MGEEVCAWIKFEEGKSLEAEDLVNFCKKKIAHFKIPRYFRFVKDFPVKVTGKVKKNEIRHITNELLKTSNHDIIDVKHLH